ncbi:phosphotransferase [Halobacillus salinus]|uniref:Aminoglycoside phosphotransferase domain-containing protein n=1 Tax=Halobacillus salinus TaxID=192814 RepID=A0A4Z0H635_9BACI|nr:phosphotransferase [Halobacillus salinus]TGB04871.1 hypothetical protein E4663_07715 [Halobacillus salinus]
MNPWDATHPTTISQAKEKLKQFKDLEPHHIELIGTGFDHTVYAVNHQYAFRFPRRKMGYEAMLTESNVLHQLVNCNLPIPIPQPVYSGQASQDDFPFVGFTLLEGNVLTDEDDTALVSKEGKRLGQFLKHLHSLNVTAPPDHLNRLSIKVRKPKLIHALQHVQSFLPKAVSNQLNCFLTNITTSSNPKGTTFVHGDFHPKNVVVKNGFISGIIDWGDAHIGHPAIDLAFIFMAIPGENREDFFNEYGAIDKQTEEMARFRALFTSVMLLQYATDMDDDNVKRWALVGIENALE